MKRRIACAGAAVVAISFFLVMGRRIDPAYAQLLRTVSAYHSINTVHFKGWRLGVDGRRINIDSWFSRPYLFWMRHGKELAVRDGSRAWFYEEGAKTARFLPATEAPAEEWQRIFDVEKALERMRKGYAIQNLGVERIGGKPLRKLLLSGEGLSERETWWLDPATNLVMRMVSERAEGPLGKQWSIIGGSTLIQYDVTPPAGLFHFTPPPGVAVVPDRPHEHDHFVHVLWDGSVLARHKGTLATIELLAFSRAETGDLFLVCRPVNFVPLRLILTDSSGGRYASFNLHTAGQGEPIYTTVFF